MVDQEESVSQSLRLFTRQQSQNLEGLFSTPSHHGVLVRDTKELALGQLHPVLGEDGLYIVLDHKASMEDKVARTPYVTVRDAQSQPPPQPPQETAMTDVPSETEPTEEDVGPPMPEREVVPIEDLDKIEKLLDVSLATVNMPNLSHIKQACMEELAQIDAALAEAQAKAQEEYQVAMAEWESENRRRAEEKRKAEEEEQADAA